MVEVARTDDVDSLRGATAALAERFGAPQAVVAFKEGDLPAVTALRRQYACPGRGVEELRHFLDKYHMIRRVTEAGVPAPAFAAVDSPQDVLAFGSAHGWPLIVKPRRGSASQGVVRLDGPDGVTDLELKVPSLVQVYVPDPTFHVDGVFDGRHLRAWRASRYVNSCLAFTTGSPLGSVEVDDPRLLEHLRQFTERALRALSEDPYVFHLELFVADEDSAAPRLRFLEVGCRVGGAEIPFLWREVHGIDLMTVEWALQTGEPPVLPAQPDSAEVGGWLLMPVELPRPCLITAATSLIGTDPCLYAERVPPVGQVIPAADAYYEHVAGRFRFRGGDSAEVEAAVTGTASRFRLDARPLPRTAAKASRS
ncbi:biotin carboxylase [Streptomyces sp. NPDC050619]|uniref:ATP-grasp domain-containing protein n=1 Tax=Streptomyces sp. NPDC050619 TaxID=3157214 RepID=UPI003435D5E8